MRVAVVRNCVTGTIAVRTTDGVGSGVGSAGGSGATLEGAGVSAVVGASVGVATAPSAVEGDGRGVALLPRPSSPPVIGSATPRTSRPATTSTGTRFGVRRGIAGILPEE